MSIHIIVLVFCPAGLENMSTLHFGSALLPAGWADDVQVVVTDGIITRVTIGTAPENEDERHQLAIPGIASLHSHAFQRGMAGLAETRGNAADTFWTWRETMYRFALDMTPEDTEAVATLLYVEMLEQGYTRVGEFHYLHHDRDGTPYADPAEMARRIARAAEITGIGLTLLPSFYAHSSFGGAAPHAGQRRFICSIDQYVKLIAATRTAVCALPGANVGVAPHSLRAVTPDELAAIVPLADSMEIPVGASLGFHGGGVTLVRAAMATRVTRTDVPWSLNSHIGAVAGPRLVSAGPVVSRAPVICKGTQSEQSPFLSALIAEMAS